ncbi:ParB N-terminal domain-containing protein [Sulfobacillus sp. hq2]|uniref:ParB N-terminal domain-containing protein n=1 Tax=Sulfobacillus sp. hq2 TaxID=2039167 RepID=UPI000CD1FB16|nr:ParB N-terminal domain-containing protein [Sulfobacillus sp. hq2]POB11048.1 hypothetical protein CO251_05715 [Sulfobacillus sp. hq2]
MLPCYLARLKDRKKASGQLPTLSSQLADALKGKDTTKEDIVPAVASSSIMQIPLSAIVVGGVNARREFDEDRLAELQHSIERDGLLQFPVVAPEPGVPDKWHLLAGERRYRAICELGWTTIPVCVMLVLRQQWRRIMMEENLTQASFSLAEELSGFIAMVEHDGYSVSQIIHELSLDKGCVYGLLRLYRNVPLRVGIDDGTINGKKILKPLNRLITDTGDERYPGLVDKSLRLIAQQHPSVAALNAAIDDWITELDYNLTEFSRRRRSPGSAWERERRRVQEFVAKSVKNLDHEAIMEIARVYDEVAKDLQRLAAESNRSVSTISTCQPG